MICKHCGKSECITGRKYCESCREWHKNYYKERRARLRESGLCIMCGTRESVKFQPAHDNVPEVSASIHCTECRDKNRERSRRIKRAAVEKGLCHRCRKNSAASKTYCDECESIVRAKARESEIVKVKSRMSRGICSDCRRIATDVSSLGKCIECHCKQLSHLRHMIGSSWVDLVDIWNSQHGVCALSGLPMLLKDAEIDHIIPVHSDGTCSKENLRWVLKSANRMKGKMLDADLIAMCKSIVSHMDR